MGPSVLEDEPNPAKKGKLHSGPKRLEAVLTGAELQRPYPGVVHRGILLAWPGLALCLLLHAASESRRRSHKWTETVLAALLYKGVQKTAKAGSRAGTVTSPVVTGQRPLKLTTALVQKQASHRSLLPLSPSLALRRVMVSGIAA